MVLLNGRPQDRRFPERTPLLAPAIRQSLKLPTIKSFQNMVSYKPSKLTIDTAVTHLQNQSASRDHPSGSYGDRKLTMFAANLDAFIADVSKDDLKKYIRTRTRFDLEQAAAVVVSAFMKEGRVDDAVCLVKQLGTVMATSSMWIDPNAPLATSNGPFVSPGSLARKLQHSAASREVHIPLANNFHQLLLQLMRIRRSKPNDRCLHIPQWLFEETGIEAPDHFRAQFEHIGIHPVKQKDDESIMLSRKHFRSVQRHILHLYQFWKPDIKLRKSIKKLEDKVLFAGSWIQKRVFDLDDVAMLAHYFFYFQRRLQRKVVSDLSGYVFLGKGDGMKFFQNNMTKKSTFENVLLDIAESNEEGVAVAMGSEDTLSLIDETCLLMKTYVDIYGGGKTENLVFKQGVQGGKGRGPVDEYNLLCDVLTHLKDQAKDEGHVDVPGQTKKFLAKDIMHWNNAWENDAFAGDEKAGWEDWLRKRGLVENGDWDMVDV
jgi:hypothetical protein